MRARVCIYVFINIHTHTFEFAIMEIWKYTQGVIFGKRILDERAEKIIFTSILLCHLAFFAIRLFYLMVKIISFL